MMRRAHTTLTKTLKGFSSGLAGVLEKSVHSRHGLINTLQEEPPAPEALGIRLVHAVTSPPTYYRRNAYTATKTTERGTGAAFSYENACWAAVGEALERYAASIYWPEDLVTASAGELGTQAICLRKLIRGGKPEIRLFNPTAKRVWARGVEMVSQRPVLVPAAMTYLGYSKTDDDELINQNDSTGLACGASIDGASLNAICEVIERDVFASTWLLGRRPPQLRLGAAIERLDMPVQMALRSNRLSVKLFYLAQAFGVHVVLCLVETPEGYGVVGAAASPFILRAIEKAVCEGLFSWTGGYRAYGKKKIAGIADIRSTTDHLFYYLDTERFKVVKEMCASDASVALADLLVSECGHVTGTDIAINLAKDGLVASMIDLTTEDVASLQLNVVRVVVPGLQPLIFGPSCMLAPDERRLNQWRTLWGIRGTSLNPHPHPFP